MKALSLEADGSVRMIDTNVEHAKAETKVVERDRACAIVLKHIVPPENDGYWFNDVLKDIVRQIKGI